MALDFSHEASVWIARWSRDLLPALPQTVQQLKVLLPRIEGARPQAIAEIVLRDPLFSLQAVRGINSMPRGRYGAPVLDMSNIVLLLGARRFVQEFADMPVLADQTPAAVRLPCLQLVQQARLAALLAAEWGKLRLDTKVEELYLAALLHPLRDWIILFDAELQRSLAARDPQAQALVEWLHSRDALPVWTGLLEAWKLPEHFVDLLLESRQQTARAQCVALAIQLARDLQRGWFDAQVQQTLVQTATVLKQDMDVLWPLVRQTLLREARQQPVPDLLPLAAWLPLLPPPPPEAEPEAAGEPAVASSAAAAPPPAVDNGPTLPDKGVLFLRAQPAETPFKTVLPLALQTLHRNFGLTRLVLFMPSGQQLVARHVVGDPSWNSVVIPLDGQLLFARLMGKTQTLWLHKDNRQRLQALLGRDERRLMGEDPWLAASLVRDGRPLALILGARTPGSSSLSSADYLSFGRLIQEVERRLA